jgi:TPR repeat protein
MNNLGYLYANGKGVATDYAKAREWFQKSAALGDVKAMVATVQLYEKGLGMAVDLKQAAVWYRKAADAGDVPPSGG